MAVPGAFGEPGARDEVKLAKELGTETKLLIAAGGFRRGNAEAYNVTGCLALPMHKEYGMKLIKQLVAVSGC